jgi:hypothetical protein
MGRLALVALLSGWALAGCTPDEPVTRLATPAAPGSSLPRLTRGDATVVLSWVEPADGGHALRYATLSGTGWSAAHTVVTGSNWLVNWADFPSVVPVTGSFWAAHWLVRHGDSAFAYDIMTSVSVDGGKAWHAPEMLNDDGTATEHGFVSLFPAKSSEPPQAGVVWLDGRNTVAGGDGMTLRSATLDAAGRVHAPALVDDLVCDCCQTDVATAATGPVVAYRNRTADEIRDIYIARLDDGWAAGRPVADDGWEIDGCPVNGPAIAAHEGHAAVAWYTGAGSRPRILVAFSEDSAANFAPPIEVADGPVMGRVDVVLLDDAAAAVSWLGNVRTDDGVRAEVRVRRIRADGSVGAVRTIARTGAGRPAGFPQMLRVGQLLLFAWTDTVQQESRVLTAHLSLGAL